MNEDNLDVQSIEDPGVTIECSIPLSKDMFELLMFFLEERSLELEPFVVESIATWFGDHNGEFSFDRD